MSLLALLAAAALLLLLPAGAQAGPHSSVTAAVSMGDSYISGEAGRWAGNSLNPAPGNDGTDRACVPIGSPVCQPDKSRVYLGGSDANGCDRSDVAEIQSARLSVARRFNIACSGAVTNNIFRASHGGQLQKGEAPEADQLLPIAQQRNVRLIVLSIGGNDFGFASIVAACFQAYETRSAPCNPEQEQKVRAARSQVIASIRKAITEIQAVMTTAGYSRGDYRLIVQSYPSVAPRASENRYAEDGGDRSANGCPFYDADSNWARNQAVYEIGSAVITAARDEGAEVMNLADAFQGHEFCSKFARQVTASDHPSAAQIEWGRILGPTSIQQNNGSTQEVFHPDAFGQQAIGSCLTTVAAARPGEFTCAGAANRAPDALTPTRPRAVTARLGCLPGRAPIGTRNVGRVRLGRTRGQLLRRVRVRPVRRTRYSYRWCAHGSRGHVVAVFSRGAGSGRARLVVTTVGGHRMRGVGRGAGLLRLQSRFPGARRLGRGLYRARPHSPRVFGVRRGRVRFTAVADKRLLRSTRTLRRYLRRAGL
jgi:hypothetical protein